MNEEAFLLPDVPEGGLFTPSSVMWKVNRERALLLGGPAAAVLQVAHPRVARGVAEHSDFRNDSRGRLQRTLDAVYTISFGTAEEVRRTASQVRKMHQRVQSGAIEGRPGYSAFDDDLQMWVLATLVHGATSMYRRFVGELNPEECEEYLRGMRMWGEFFGLARTYGPQNWREFEAYYESMIHDPLLGGEPVCAEVVRHIVQPRRPISFRLAVPLLHYLVTETIPPPLRERLGLHSTPMTRGAWALSLRLFPTLYRTLPSALRYPPEYRNALKRFPTETSSR